MPIHAVAAIVIASVAAIPSNVLPVMVGLLSDFRSLDEATLGLLIASGTSAGLVASLSAPHWIGRVNLRYVIGAALVVEGLGLLGLRFGPGIASLFVAQMLAGGAAIVVASGCLTVIARLPNPTRAYGIKITVDVIFAGAFLALLPTSDWGLAGFVGVLAAASFAAASLAARLPASAPIAQHTDGAPTRARDAHWSAWLLLLMIVVFYIGAIGVWAFLERFAVHAGVDRDTVSTAIAAGLIVGVIGSLGAAVFAGRTVRIWPQTLSAIVLVGSIAMLIRIDSALQFYVAVFVLNCSWNFFMPFVIGLVAARDDTGRLPSLVPGTVMIGGILGPVLAGAVIRSHGHTVAMIVLTTIVALSIAGYVAIARPLRTNSSMAAATPSGS